MISLPCPSSLSKPYAAGSRARPFMAQPASIVVSLPTGDHLAFVAPPLHYENERQL